MALMPCRTPLPAPGTRVGFIDNDEFGTGPQELVAAAVGLDEVKGNDDEGMVLKQGLSQRQPTLQPCSGAGKNQSRANVELVTEFALPLFGQLRRAEDRETRDFAPIQ